MKKLTQQDRIIATGEMSNHCHVIFGDVEISIDPDGKTIIEVGEDANASLRHVLQDRWLAGEAEWTGEHKDIVLKPGRYEYVPQTIFDPLTKRISLARD